MSEYTQGLYTKGGTLNREAQTLIAEWEGKEIPADVDARIDTLLTESQTALIEARKWEGRGAAVKDAEATLNSVVETKRLAVGGDPVETKAAASDLQQKAFDAYLHGGLAGLSDAHRTAMRGMRDRDAKAALNETTTTQGGFLTPVIYEQMLVAALTDLSIVRSAGARIIALKSDDTRIPVITNSSAAVLTAEAASVSEVEPTFSEVTYVPYKYTRLAKASSEVVEDSRFDVWNEILMPDYAQAFAAAENVAFTTGTGSSQPQGFVVGSTLGVTAASATTVTMDEVINLYHALGYLYRSRPSTRWMLSDTTIGIVRKLKDTTNQYLWRPGLEAGEPDRLMGVPVITNNSMPAATTGLKSIVIGDFSYFGIGDRAGFAVKVLNELYAGNDQVGFLGIKRFDSHVLLATAFYHLIQA